jgi:hypothetical protein
VFAEKIAHPVADAVVTGVLGARLDHLELHRQHCPPWHRFDDGALRSVA